MFVIFGGPLIGALTLDVLNFVNMEPFLPNQVPIKRCVSELSIGTKLVKNASISRKLWTNKVVGPNTL